MAEKAHLELDDVRVPELRVVQDFRLDVFVDRTPFQELHASHRRAKKREGGQSLCADLTFIAARSPVPLLPSWTKPKLPCPSVCTRSYRPTVSASGFGSMALCMMISRTKCDLPADVMRAGAGDRGSCTSHSTLSFHSKALIHQTNGL